MKETTVREDGWYFVKPSGSLTWMVAWSREGEWIVGKLVHEVPILVSVVGPRIPSPDEAPAPAPNRSAGAICKTPNGMWHWQTASDEGYCLYREDAERHIAEQPAQPAGDQVVGQCMSCGQSLAICRCDREQPAGDAPGPRWRTGWEGNQWFLYRDDQRLLSLGGYPHNAQLVVDALNAATQTAPPGMAEFRTEWGIRSHCDGTHKGPMTEAEAREWVERFPQAYVLVSRQYSKWLPAPPSDEKKEGA